MKGKEKFQKFVSKHPHVHAFPATRPRVTRRRFFELLGTGVTGAVLAGPAFSGNTARAKRFIGNMNNLIIGATQDPDTMALVIERPRPKPAALRSEPRQRRRTKPRLPAALTPPATTRHP